MNDSEIRKAFEELYSSGDNICDAMSMAKRDDGEYEQALARLCSKWFNKGHQAALQSLPRVTEEELVELQKAIARAYEARCGDKYSAEEVNGKVRGALDSLCIAITAKFPHIVKHESVRG